MYDNESRECTRKPQKESINNRFLLRFSILDKVLFDWFVLKCSQQKYGKNRQVSLKFVLGCRFHRFRIWSSQFVTSPIFAPIPFAINPCLPVNREVCCTWVITSNL